MTDALRGLSLPFRIDADGRLATTSGAAKLRDNIILALLTAQGERPRRRGHGASLWALEHEPLGGAAVGLARRRILQTIREAEPRVEVVDLRIAPAPGEEGVLLIELDFVDIRTRARDRLSIPLASP